MSTVFEGLLLSGDGGPWRVVCLEVSLGGCRIELPAAVPQGALLRLYNSERLWLVEVIWCSGEGNRYTAGCRIEHAIQDLRRLHIAMQAHDWPEPKPEPTQATN